MAKKKPEPEIGGRPLSKMSHDELLEVAANHGISDGLETRGSTLEALKEALDG